MMNAEEGQKIKDYNKESILFWMKQYFSIDFPKALECAVKNNFNNINERLDELSAKKDILLQELNLLITQLEYLKKYRDSK